MSISNYKFSYNGHALLQSGNLITALNPPWLLFSRKISLPWLWTISCAMERPRPRPPGGLPQG
ncbi:MAG: hypothetical protein V1721_03910 [Pseudomonadota bacterium]